MTYAQKSFLGYFGQNWAKIKKKFFGNSLYIAAYKKPKKPQKYCLNSFYPKKFFLTGRLLDPIESDPVIRKQLFQQIWNQDT
jgi:hypothetical protein